VLAHYLFSHLLTVLTSIASMFIMIRLLATPRTPQSLLAWIVSLIFFPFAAIPLYLLLGTRKLPRKAKRQMRMAATHSDAPTPVAKMLNTLGAPPARACTDFELLGTGEQAYARLLALITEAAHSIDLTMFIFGDDATGHRVLDALAERAKAGVRVRLILDAMGSHKIKRRAIRAMHAAGGAVRIFMPLIHAPLRGRNNLRSHRKLAVFDRTHLFIGGMNIAEEYMGATPRPGRWRDLAACVSGPVAGDALAIFESDWEFCGGASPHEASPAPLDPRPTTMQLVPSGPDMAQDTFYNAILTAIFVARTRIAIVTPYYVPDDVVQCALALAARRGVRVELVLPLRSNHALADFARRGLLRELAAAGVALRFYPHGMVHAKTMVVDDTFAYVGSPNFDMRSFFLNYEDALCLYGSEDIAQARAWIDGLIAECTATPPHSGHEHWLLEQLARLLTPEL
jgi:cardiolipin synthase